MSLPSNGWTRPRGNANCFSSPTNPAAACSNLTAIELVDCPMYGECEISTSPKTSNASFWIGPRWWRAKEALSAAGGALGLKGYQVLLGPTRRRPAHGLSPYGPIMHPEALQRRVSLVL